jgi:two-component system NarL family sensor kinase
MEKAAADVIVAIILASILVVVLAVFTLLFFLVYVRKKRILQKNKEELSQTYEKALLQTTVEIQEQTLNYISQEIHDNIGQVLSFVKLSLANTSSLADADKQVKINEGVTLIAEVISDLRDLSKSLSFEKIKKEGLCQVVKDEASRLNRNNVIRTEVSVQGMEVDLGEQRELLLFRIFQEITNNSLKHSGSDVLRIALLYTPKLFTMTVQDRGKGFDTGNQSQFKGLGLENIRQRAALIGATAEMESSLGMGCSTTIKLDLGQLHSA